MWGSLPGDSMEVDRGAPPMFTEFVGLALLTEEYPEVETSRVGSEPPY